MNVKIHVFKLFNYCQFIFTFFLFCHFFYKRRQFIFYFIKKLIQFFNYRFRLIVIKQCVIRISCISSIFYKFFIKLYHLFQIILEYTVVIFSFCFFPFSYRQYSQFRIFLKLIFRNFFHLFK